MTEYRALDMLIKQHPPTVDGKKPFWRPRPADCHREVREPSWRWSMAVPDDVESLVVLDVNAAFLAAASSVEVAHGQLVHTGPTVFDRRRPGYWLIDLPAWNDPRIVHPLGHGVRPTMWVTTPTMALLAQLQDHGLLELAEPLDSWTCDTRCRLRAWTDHVKTDRATTIALGLDRDATAERQLAATERLDVIKQGYSVAVTLMGNETGSAIYRPDWAQHIRAQHAATMWRRMWGLVQAQMPVYASGTVDEIVIDHRDATACWKSGQTPGHHPPVKIDQHTRALGTVKVKDVLTRDSTDWPTTT